MQYLFDFLKDITVLSCGHTLHLQCLQDMHKHFQYNRPLCSKSACDMSEVWTEIDREVAATHMPADQNRTVWIICNDCSATSKVQYHFVRHKCGSCPSYNTRLTETPATPS